MSLTEKQKRIKQIPFRFHDNDHKAFKSKCLTDGFTMQSLVEACVLAYIDGDGHVKLLAQEHKNMNTVNKKKASWSSREGTNLLAEIENLDTDE